MKKLLNMSAIAFLSFTACPSMIKCCGKESFVSVLFSTSLMSDPGFFMSVLKIGPVVKFYHFIVVGRVNNTVPFSHKDVKAQRE